MKKPKQPTCTECGCTELKPCEGGCAWMVLDDKTNQGLCSACFSIDASNDVILVTPRWSADCISDPRLADPLTPLFEFEKVEEGWLLTLAIMGQVYSLPVREGDPEGEIVDVAPGIKTWASMERYGLTQLGPGVWRVTPSLYVPGELHAFLVLCDVPEPAPFAQPVLFSASGERLRSKS